MLTFVAKCHIGYIYNFVFVHFVQTFCVFSLFLPNFPTAEKAQKKPLTQAIFGLYQGAVFYQIFGEIFVFFR